MKPILMPYPHFDPCSDGLKRKKKKGRLEGWKNSWQCSFVSNNNSSYHVLRL